MGLDQTTSTGASKSGSTVVVVFCFVLSEKKKSWFKRTIVNVRKVHTTGDTIF